MGVNSKINKQTDPLDREASTGAAAARKAVRDIALGGAADGRTFEEREDAKASVETFEG